MGKHLTSSSFINSVKRRAAIPSNQNTFTDQDFLDFANEETDTELVPEILRLHEDYFLFSEEIDLEQGVSRYTIPDKAIGNKLREVAYIDNQGNTFELSRISVGELSEFDYPYSNNIARTFYVENNEIVLVPTIENALEAKIRFTYYRRLNALVPEDQIAIITTIDRTSGEIGLANIPEDFSITKKFDLISTSAPFKTLNPSITASALNNTTNTLTVAITDISDKLQVGDHVALEGECIIPQVPQELHAMLAHRVAMRCMEAQGDLEGMQAASAKAQRMEGKLASLIDNRVEEAPRKVWNRHSSLRRGLFRRRYKYRG